MKVCDKNFKICKNGKINQVYLNLNKLDFNINNTAYIMKKLAKLYNSKRKVQFILDDESYLENEEKYVYDNIFNIIVLIKTIMLNNKRERISYLYDKICFYLDSECVSKNLCGFENNICIGKRGTCVENGCCHKYKKFFLFSFKEKPVLCDYLVDGKCSAKSIGCKLFMCDKIVSITHKKFTINNVLLIKYCFNFFQKLVILSSVFQKREIIIKKLCFLEI